MGVRPSKVSLHNGVNRVMRCTLGACFQRPYLHSANDMITTCKDMSVHNGGTGNRGQESEWERGGEREKGRERGIERGERGGGAGGERTTPIQPIQAGRDKPGSDGWTNCTSCLIRMAIWALLDISNPSPA
jgi:hypothetical protein